MKVFLDIIDIIFLHMQHIVVDLGGMITVTMCHERHKDLIVTAVVKFHIKSKSGWITSIQMQEIDKKRVTISHDLQEKIKEYLVVLFKSFFDYV